MMSIASIEGVMMISTIEYIAAYAIVSVGIIFMMLMIIDFVKEKWFGSR